MLGLMPSPVVTMLARARSWNACSIASMHSSSTASSFIDMLPFIGLQKSLTRGRAWRMAESVTSKGVGRGRRRKGAGRPRITKTGKTSYFSTRITPETRALLETEARLSGLSLSTTVERLLRRVFKLTGNHLVRDEGVAGSNPATPTTSVEPRC